MENSDYPLVIKTVFVEKSLFFDDVPGEKHPYIYNIYIGFYPIFLWFSYVFLIKTSIYKSCPG